MRNFVYILLLLTSPTIAQLDELRAELKHVVEANNSSNGMTMGVDYFMYKDHDSKDVYEHHRGYYHKKGSMFKNFIYGSLTIQNEDYMMVKDDSVQVIMLGKPVKNITPEGVEISKLLEHCSSVKILTPKRNGHKAFQLIFKAHPSIEYNKMDVYFNKKHILEEIVLYHAMPVDYSKDPRKPDMHKSKMQIVYSKINVSANLTKADFDLRKYFVKKNNKFIVTSEYRTYELMLSPELKAEDQ